MHIYLDESGSFVIPERPGSSISVMGALVVPACYKNAIWKRYRRMRAHWPKDDDEAKGRLLKETHVAALVEMLVKTPVLFNVIAIDMGMQTPEGIIKHRDGQVRKLLLSVGPEHRPSMIAEVEQMASRLAGTSPQLYTQSVLIFELVRKVLQHSTLLHSQILPKELGAVSLIFDAKDKNKITNWEEWWKKMIAPFLQAIALRKPIIGLKEGDYSYFDRAFASGSGFRCCRSRGIVAVARKGCEHQHRDRRHRDRGIGQQQHDQ